MDVSVVIPTRNRPELLALTLLSAVRQDGVVAEVIVVDDGHGPATEDLVNGLRVVGRARVLRNTGPPGVSGARNTGIAAATGSWVAFLDDDDLWAPTKLASQLSAAAAAGAGWVYGGDVTVDATLRIRSGAPPPPPERVVAELTRHNAVPAGASNVAVRRDVLAAVGGFDPALQTSEDWDLWLRLAQTGLPACVSRPIVALRSHAGMASRRVDRMLNDIEVMRRRYGIPVDRARHERWAAWICLEEGQRWAALRHYSQAVRAGDIASVVRAAVAVVYPQLARRRSAYRRTAWADDAQQWLDELLIAAEQSWDGRE